jgi:DNA polymerase elongation subunit (family B)
MSYIDAYTSNGKVYVWERNGDRRSRQVYTAPYNFYIQDGAIEGYASTEKFTGLDGSQLVKVECDSYNEMTQLVNQLTSKSIRVYESDILPEIKILSDHYFKLPEPKLNISLFDIEVDYDPVIGWSTTENPYAPVNAISIYHCWNNKTVTFAVPPDGWSGEFDKSMHDLSDIYLCSSERELLICMLDEFKNSDIISGWNSSVFDLPYIAKRLELLGPKFVNRLCFPECPPPKYRVFENMYGSSNLTVDLYGRQHLDYMELFKKYEQHGQPSYKLQNIADEFLPELPKLKYDGTLADLYHTDFEYFVRYNIRDTEILRGLEKKLGYARLANTMAHTAGIKFSHVMGTIKPAETAIINFCHHEKNVKVPNWIQKPDASIEGAYVLYPQIGMHHWISNVDVSSLYPSTIRTLNISPETIVGQFTSLDKAWSAVFKGTDTQLTLVYEDGETDTRSAIEWKTILAENRWAISGYGTVFDQSYQGVIPSILTRWYSQRKEFQGLKNQTLELLNDDIENTELQELADYYDKQQYVRKIQLNALYGALTNMYFKFFDVRMGASTTYSGRQILLHQIRKIGEILDGSYDFDPPLDCGEFQLTGKFPSPSILAGDTDSCYFLTYASSTDEAIEIADGISVLVNKSFPEFARSAFLCTQEFDSLISCGREIVADSGIFVEKKRYIMHLTDFEGHRVNKLKIMGLDFKRTTLPKVISNKLVDMLKTILVPDPDWKQFDKDVVEYKRELKKSSVFDLGLPKGVNNVAEYTQRLQQDPKSRTPGHVMGSILWNALLEEHNDKQSLRICDGMKIKVFYLTKKIGRAKSIAVPVDMTVFPDWFTDEIIPIINIEDQLQRLVDGPLDNTLKAVNRKAGSEQRLLFDSIFEF